MRPPALQFLVPKCGVDEIYTSQNDSESASWTEPRLPLLTLYTKSIAEQALHRDPNHHQSSLDLVRSYAPTTRPNRPLIEARPPASEESTVIRIDSRKFKLHYSLGLQHLKLFPTYPTQTPWDAGDSRRKVPSPDATVGSRLVAWGIG